MSAQWIKLRYLADFNPAPPNAVRNSPDSFPLYPMEAINNFKAPNTAISHEPVSKLLSGYSYLEPRDVAYAKVTPCFENGKGIIGKDLQDPSFATTELTVLRPKPGISQRYLAYLLQSPLFKDQAQSSMTGAGGLKRVSEQFVKDIKLPVPSFRAQEKIADQLDRELAEIDASIEDQLQFQKLSQERLAVLKELLVTGFESNGSKTISHSIPWLRGIAIPTNWQVWKLGRLLRLQSGNTLTSEDIDSVGFYPVYGGGGFRGYTNSYTNDGEHIMIGRQGALCGKIFSAEGKFFATEHAIVTYPNQPVDLVWLKTMLEVMNLGQYSTSAAQPGIAVDAINKLVLPVPPLKEQKRISSQIIREEGKYLQISNDIFSYIKLTKEYKISLIRYAQ